MRKYISFFRIRLIAGLQYRAAAWAGIFTQAVWGLMLILMYRAFYKSGSDAFPMEFGALSTYIWLQEALLTLFAAWAFDNDIFDSITSGAVAYELCRPCGMYGMWFVKNMAMRIARVALRCLPIVVVAALLPAPYGLTLPAGFGAGVLFLVSLVLGVLVSVSFVMLVYISAFYTLSSSGVRVLGASMVEFLSGVVIPLPFFPEKLQKALNLLPFASMQNTPFLIYTGHLDPQTALERIGLQLLWLALLLAAGRLLIANAQKKVVVQGG